MFSERTHWNRQANELTLALERLRTAGRQVLDLTRSNPTECGFAHDEEGIRRALVGGEVLRYRPDARGMAVARDAVEAYYKNQRDERVSSDDIVLTCGTSEAYSFLFRLLCNAGDEVLIPAPGYPLFDFLADLCDVKLVRFPLVYDHGWQIDFGALAAAATGRTGAVIVVHPNNPTGHYVAAQEQVRLAQFCRERGLALIADEVFLDFSLSESPARSFVACNQALTFTLSGLSKICGMPQMKLAWIAVSGLEPEKQEALARLEVIADAYLSVGTQVQLAAPALLEMRGAFQRQVIERVRRNLTELDRQLAQQEVCARLECEGGWTAVLRVPALQSDEELAIALLSESGVLVHPGHFYDFARPGHIVVSLIVPEQEFAEGMRRVFVHFNAAKNQPGSAAEKILD
jgi:alanine-synthesizing transaminase